MFFKRFGWRPIAASLAVWAFLPLFSSPAHAEKTAGLSGYVYLDYNGDDVLDPLVDYALRFAKVTLKRDGDPSFSVVAITDAAGFYRFENINVSGGGSFSLLQTCYTCTDGYDSVGRLYDENGAVVSSAAWGTSHNGSNDALANQITGIQLLAGYNGVNYNFASKTYPLELISKRMYMDLGPPTTVANAVPEPSSVALVLLAGGFMMGIVVRRRQRR
jgi:hypothetical protein